MRLTKVEAENIKGQSFSWELKSCTAIVGPNFSGKTAIIEAIRLAVMGYIPEVGKRPGSSWELSSGPKMSVGVEFDDGRSITRRWTLTNGLVKEAATSLLFAESLCHLPLLNAEHYFTLSERERTNYVFERMKLPSSYTPEAIVAEAERISFGEEHTEQHEKAKAEMVDKLRRSFGSLSIQEALNEAVKTFKELFTFWNQRVKDTIGATRLLTELKNKEEATSDSITDLERAISEIRQRHDQLNRELGAAEEQERVAGRRATTASMRLCRSSNNYSSLIRGAEERIEALKSQIAGEGTAYQLECWRQSLVMGTKKYGEVESQEIGVRQQIADLNATLTELEKAKECPFCHSKGKNWRTHARKYLATTVLSLEKEGNKSATLLHEIKEELEQVNAQVTSALEAVSKNALLQQAIQDEEQKMAAWTKEESDQRRWEEERAALEKEEAADALPALINLPALKTERERLVKEQVDRAVRLGDARNLQQDLKRAAQSELEYLKAKASLDVVKALGKLVADKRAGMIDDILGELLFTADAIAGDILPSPLVFSEGVIGRLSETKFVPHRVFSGVEKSITYVAIAAALSAQAPLKLLLLDELGRMTIKVRTKVLQRITAAVADGTLDQAIVVLPSDIPLQLPEWNCLNLPNMSGI